VLWLCCRITRLGNLTDLDVADRGQIVNSGVIRPKVPKPLQNADETCTGLL
jgi:hypothetical protein